MRVSNTTSRYVDDDLTVIVPVFNEANTVAECVSRVLDVANPHQIIIVDDGSSDSTPQVAAQLVVPPQITLLRHDRNCGKGAAIRTALTQTTGRFVIIQDADLEYAPADYPQLLQPLLSNEADVVYGSRYLGREDRFPGRRRFDWGVRLLNWAVHILYGVRITDEATCYKLAPAAVLRRMELQCERFEFCPEVTAKACRLGLRIREVPIRYSPRSIEEGKKIRLRDGFEALWTLWRFRRWRPNRECEQGSHRLPSQTAWMRKPRNRSKGCSPLAD